MVNEIIRAMEWAHDSGHFLDYCLCANCTDYRFVLSDLKRKRNIRTAPIPHIGAALADAGLLLNNITTHYRCGTMSVEMQAYVLGISPTSPCAIKHAIKELAEWTAE